MDIKNLPLITVAFLKKKHLNQIKTINYEAKVYRELAADLMSEKPNRVVRYWFYRDTDNNFASKQKLWLIEGPLPGQLSIMIPPDAKDYEGNPVPLWEKYKDVPQLFVD